MQRKEEYRRISTLEGIYETSNVNITKTIPKIKIKFPNSVIFYFYIVWLFESGCEKLNYWDKRMVDNTARQKNLTV